MAEILIRLFENSKRRGVCRGRACARPVDWFETTRGKWMPMDPNAVPRKSDTDRASGRVIGFYSADDSHWRTCVDASQFGHDK
jgi:hypothetical protein